MKMIYDNSNEFKDFKTNAHVVYYNSSEDLCNYFKIDKSKIKFNEPFCWMLLWQL